MAIRSVAKAVVLRDDRLLLIKSIDDSGIRYQFPGGGQIIYETLTETLRRECAEETGYRVEVGRLLAVCEEIVQDPRQRRLYPDYTHRLCHLFLCSVRPDAQAPTVVDAGQVGFEWVPLSELARRRLQPTALADALPALLTGASPLYLGAQFI